MKTFLLILLIVTVVFFMKTGCTTGPDKYDKEIAALSVGDIWKFSYSSSPHVTLLKSTVEENKYMFERSPFFPLYFTVDRQQKITIIER